MFTTGRYPLLILAASAALLLGAFAFQYIGGLQPCVLCVYQRYPHGVVIGLALAALLLAPPRGRAAMMALAGVALLAGAAVAAFHVGVEQKWWEGLPGCSGGLPTDLSLEEMMKRAAGKPPARCDEVPWSLFGISMAGYNFLLSLALAALSFVAARNFWSAAR